MDVKQVYEIVNECTKQAIGEEALVQENLANIVDVGDTLDNRQGLDAFAQALPNVIGRMVFVTRKYSGSLPYLMRDGWEFGSILGKVHSKIPTAQENESWELTDGASYDGTIFKKPEVFTKFFNKKVTFEIQMSIAEKQLKQSFHSPQEMNAFVSMIYNEVDKSMTVKIDELSMRGINNMIAATVKDGVGTTYTNTSFRAVNLLKIWNDAHSGATLTAAEAIKNAEFIRFAIQTINLYKQRMTRISTLFNMGGTEKFTPADRAHIVTLADFDSAAQVYLYDAANQFRVDNLSIGEHDVVPYWQGSGTSFNFSDVSEVKVKTAGGDTIDITGVIGILHDVDAIALCNEDRRVTSQYVPKAEFYNYFYKWDMSIFNDYNENFVVFYLYAA